MSLRVGGPPVRPRGDFAEALGLYRAGNFQQAKSAFLELLSVNGADRTYRLYLDRIESHLKFPPVEWRGYEVLTEK